MRYRIPTFALAFASLFVASPNPKSGAYDDKELTNLAFYTNKHGRPTVVGVNGHAMMMVSWNAEPGFGAPDCTYALAPAHELTARTVSLEDLAGVDIEPDDVPYMGKPGTFSSYAVHVEAPSLEQRYAVTISPYGTGDRPGIVNWDGFYDTWLERILNPDRNDEPGQTYNGSYMLPFDQIPAFFTPQLGVPVLKACGQYIAVQYPATYTACGITAFGAVMQYDVRRFEFLNSAF